MKSKARGKPPDKETWLGASLCAGLLFLGWLLAAMQFYPVAFSIDDKKYEWSMLLRTGTDHDMLLYFRDGRLPEPAVFHVMHRALRPGDVVVDGGAHHGMFSIFMSRCVGLSGRVIAFEPDPDCAAQLHENLRLNGVTNVEVRECALWSEEKALAFHMRVCRGLSSLYPHLKESPVVAQVQVPGVRLHDIDVPVRLIKLDIEGAELEALRAAGRHLRGCPYIICEWNDIIARQIGHDNRDLIVLMRSLGYSVFALGDDKVEVLLPGQMLDGLGNVLFAYTG